MRGGVVGGVAGGEGLLTLHFSGPLDDLADEDFCEAGDCLDDWVRDGLGESLVC